LFSFPVTRSITEGIESLGEIIGGVAIFKVDETNGTLTKVGYQLTGIHPRNFIITPNGKYLFLFVIAIGIRVDIEFMYLIGT